VNRTDVHPVHVVIELDAVGAGDPGHGPAMLGPDQEDTPSHGVPLRPVDSQRRVSSQEVEVGVGMEQRDVGANRDRADEAVDQLSDCLAAVATRPVQRRRVFVVDRLDCEGGSSAQQRRS
jgi:hypothetical protein